MLKCQSVNLKEEKLSALSGEGAMINLDWVLGNIWIRGLKNVNDHVFMCVFANAKWCWENH